MDIQYFTQRATTIALSENFYLVFMLDGTTEVGKLWSLGY